MHIGWSVGRMAGVHPMRKVHDAVINTLLDFTAAGTLHVHTKCLFWLIDPVAFAGGHMILAEARVGHNLL